MTKTKKNLAFYDGLHGGLVGILFAVLFGVVLGMALAFPGAAFADPAQDVAAQNAAVNEVAQEASADFEREYLLLDCVSYTLGDEPRSTDGRYMLLCNDGTGLFVPDAAVYQIADWNTGDGKFFATTTRGDTIEGTIGEDYLVTFTWNGAQMGYRAQDDVLPPIVNLSPDTWYESLPYVVDEAGLLTQEQLSELQARAQELTQKYSCDVRLVVVNDMGDYSEWGALGYIDPFAEEIAQGYNLGYGEDRDMIMLVMSMADRDFSLISYGPFAKEEVFDQSTRERVADGFTPAFGQNDWYQGFNDYFDTVEKALVSNETGVPMWRPAAPIHILVSVLFSLIIAFGIAYIVSSIIRSRNKSVAALRSAGEYAKPDGSEITFRSDVFQYSRESQEYSPKSSDDSSSYSSSDSDSGFGHTSGKF